MEYRAKVYILVLELILPKTVLMEQIIVKINDLVWSNALIVLCLAAGIYFSIATKFLQITHIKEMGRLLFTKNTSTTGVSSFQAFAIALCGRIGTGNIAGVATAIAFGGPGAVFWMWIMAFLGSASAFVESTLGQIYKEEKNGFHRGGPAFYIEKGLGIKWYAVAFAVMTIVSMSLCLPGVQSNSISSSMYTAFKIPVEVSGAAMVVLFLLIVMGGMKRISKVSELVVPFMSLGYMLVSFLIIAINIDRLPEMLKLIFDSAFSFHPLFGGIIGSAIVWGVKRGVYSNEAGQGTAPHAAAAAAVSHPVKQGLVQAFSIYVDTLFICSATAFMILVTGQYNVHHPSGGFVVEQLLGVSIGPGYSQFAVEQHFPGLGSAFVAISLFFFAFTSLIAYYFMAETNLAYLSKNKKVFKVGKWLIIGFIAITAYYGAVRPAEIAWTLGDIGVGSMAWLNIIAIFLLRKPALRALEDYKRQKKAGKDPVFKAEDIGIKNAKFWK